MSVQPLPGSGRIRPGHAAGYAIWVWSTRNNATNVSVRAVLRSSLHVDAPRFFICPLAEGAECVIGYLPVGQADELQASVKVRRSAAAGQRITLTATAHGSRAISFRARGSVTVASPPTSTPAPTATSPGTIPPSLLPPIPGRNISPTDPSGLFPTVSPSTGTRSSSTSGQRPDGRHVRATTVSTILPFDSRLIGGQLAGLAVLASAIAIAVARLSLRTRRPDDTGTRK